MTDPPPAPLAPTLQLVDADDLMLADVDEDDDGELEEMMDDLLEKMDAPVRGGGACSQQAVGQSGGV